MSETPDTAPVRVHADGSRTTIEVTVAAPVATVWQHLRDPELVSRWHGWDYDGLDEEIDLIYGQGAREGDEPYVLETKGGPAPGSFEHGDRFDLREQGGATVVRITRGPKGIDPGWDAMYDDITEGWISFLAQLRFTVEHQDGSARRTVFLMAGPTDTAVRELLGIEGLDPGTPYAITTEPGLQLAGTAWFRTEGQTGLTVEAYGPGLVVAADKPGEGDVAVATSMVIVSTFGLDDDAFAEVERTWQRWWAAHHEQPSQDHAAVPS